MDKTIADYQPVSVTSMGRWMDDTHGCDMPLFPEPKEKVYDDPLVQLYQRIYDFCLKTYGNKNDPRMFGPHYRLVEAKMRIDPSYGKTIQPQKNHTNEN